MEPPGEVLITQPSAESWFWLRGAGCTQARGVTAFPPLFSHSALGFPARRASPEETRLPGRTISSTPQHLHGKALSVCSSAHPTDLSLSRHSHFLSITPCNLSHSANQHNGGNFRLAAQPMFICVEASLFPKT
jgi:hypothetical protein